MKNSIIVRRVLWEGPTQRKQVALRCVQGMVQVTARLVFTNRDDEEQRIERAQRSAQLKAFDDTHPYNMGVLLHCTEESSRAEYEEAACLMEAMPSLKQCILLDVFWAADHRPDPHLFARQRAAVREAVGGPARYEAIMAEPVPMEVVVVQLLITLADEGLDMSQSLHTASDEIDAGTIRWSQQLKRIGVKHPDYWRAWRAARQVIVDRYAAWLAAYAQFHGCSRDTYHLTDIENTLVAGIERGLEDEPEDRDLLVAGAILHSELEMDSILKDLQYYEEQEERYVSPQQRYAQVIGWLRSLAPSLLASPRAEEEYRTRLTALIKQWDLLPVRFPLVPEPQDTTAER